MRRTYHYDEATKQMVEGPVPPRVAGIVSDGFYEMHPFKAHDGTIINSRRKHREYMRRHGLTTMDDYKNQWASAEKSREQFFQGKHDREERAHAIARALEKHRG